LSSGSAIWSSFRNPRKQASNEVSNARDRVMYGPYVMLDWWQDRQVTVVFNYPVKSLSITEGWVDSYIAQDSEALSPSVFTLTFSYFGVSSSCKVDII
jgi:hypothetical protein